jgi:hypothetical protein
MTNIELTFNVWKPPYWLMTLTFVGLCVPYYTLLTGFCVPHWTLLPALCVPYWTFWTVPWQRYGHHGHHILKSSSYHTTQLVRLIRANFRPHSCYWVINCSWYRLIFQRPEQSGGSNQIRAYNRHSGCRRTFKLADIQYWFSITAQWKRVTQRSEDRNFALLTVLAFLSLISNNHELKKKNVKTTI